MPFGNQKNPSQPAMMWVQWELALHMDGWKSRFFS